MFKNLMTQKYILKNNYLKFMTHRGSFILVTNNIELSLMVCKTMMFIKVQ